jgi:O-6-methylguanine DNA methyltransferase
MEERARWGRRRVAAEVDDAILGGAAESTRVSEWDLPFDLQGTAFQHRVWNSLRQIPWGQLRSYSDIAKSIGSPAAVRAVASACAANPLAIAIPCHRVIRTDNGIGGYRWGIERKKALWEMEKMDPEEEGREVK